VALRGKVDTAVSTVSMQFNPPLPVPRGHADVLHGNRGAPVLVSDA
jgi:hypothetical protein